MNGQRAVPRKQLKRREVAFFPRLEPCLIGMEARGSAHYWARKLGEFSHTVRLVAPLLHGFTFCYCTRHREQCTCGAKLEMPLRWRFRRQKAPAKVSPRVPILTYHAAHAHGYDYLGNDHLALESDLALISDLGFKIVSLDSVIEIVVGSASPELADQNLVAITFDDAPDCEYFDLYHPDFGCLKSFYRLLRESAQSFPESSPHPSAVTFVIADPEARVAIDQACLAGRGHWGDHWWHEAAETGVLRFGNHSWDHAHVALSRIRQHDQRKGTFLGIDNERDADMQIVAAQRYIWFRTAGLAVPYFAYPYGEASDYLRSEYFPKFQERHKMEAAFGTQGDYATLGTDRWHIPRFVCGEHWSSPSELEKILRGAMKGT